MGEIEVYLYGKKVNVTKWASSHPGGTTILASFHNRDATEQFEAMHSNEAKKQLFTTFLPKSPLVTSSASIVVSDSHNEKNEEYETASSEYSTDFLEFKKKLERKGLFKANPIAEFLMSLYTFSMYAIGGYLVFFTSYMWTGLFLLELGLHQSGWVSHDYLHHAILPSVYWNEIIGDFLGMLQGYDKGWWKLRHNQHHVTTNENEHDPDIAIAPLFHFIQQFPDIKLTLKSFQRYQHFYFIPTLALLDIDWRVESIIHVKNSYHKDKLPALKLLVHYLFVGMMAFKIGIFPLLMLSFVRGFMTSVIVFSNHYAEKRYISVPNLSLAEQTAYTTRNIAGGFWINFISGNISLQIEHHLFPTMPPHNLYKATPYVKKYFADHNLPYHESSIFECIGKLLWSLNVNKH